MKPAIVTGLMLVIAAAAQGASTVSPWVPIFQGIEQATGTNDSFGAPQSANALRIDLHDPSIRLLGTPPVANNYVTDQRETLLQTPREFMAEYGLQAVINCGVFSPAGYFSPSGTPASLQGVSISQGRTVSLQSSSNDCLSSLFFTTNNQATFLYINWPPSNTAGIYTAVSGLYPLLSNGVNVGYYYTNALFEDIHQQQPRTAFGLSEDGRRLILLTIDGRQPGFSDGTYDWETAEFLQLLGAYNGMNVDGGGSTCLVKADECGNPVDINQNSYQLAVSRPGSQRPVGANLGIYAKSLPTTGFIRNFSVDAGDTAATLLWDTSEPATGQVEYGLTPSYGSSSPLNATPVTRHLVSLDNLQPQTTYYYRLVSLAGSEVHTFECHFATSNAPIATTFVFDVTKSWRWSNGNLDGQNWQHPNYDDSGWPGAGPGLLYVEDSFSVSPRNTPMENNGAPYLFPGTHYFRTHFNFSGSSEGSSLLYSNYLDDAAAFYLNGTEVKRLWLPAAPTTLTYATGAVAPGGCNGAGEAVCAQLFSTPATELVQGDNVVAVEVHNRANSQDLVFGTGLFITRPLGALPTLHIFNSDQGVTLWWNGSGYTLQKASQFRSGTNSWNDVSGPITSSPYVVANPTNTTFYRLRK